jgi:hypothetical protein
MSELEQPTGSPEAQWEQVESCLEALSGAADLHCLLLLDPTGQPHGRRGSDPALDERSLGTLGAGFGALCQEVARLLGEPDGFSQLVQDGRSNRLILSPVAAGWHLLAVAPASAPLAHVTGSVRQAAHRLAELAPALAQLEDRPDDLFTEGLDAEFAQALALELDQALGGFESPEAPPGPGGSSEGSWPGAR